MHAKLKLLLREVHVYEMSCVILHTKIEIVMPLMLSKQTLIYHLFYTCRKCVRLNIFAIARSVLKASSDLT